MSGQGANTKPDDYVAICIGYAGEGSDCCGIAIAVTGGPQDTRSDRRGKLRRGRTGGGACAYVVHLQSQSTCRSSLKLKPPTVAHASES